MREKRKFPTRFKAIWEDDRKQGYYAFHDSRLKPAELRLCELNRLLKAHHKRNKRTPIDADSSEAHFFIAVEAQIKSIERHIEDVDQYDLYIEGRCRGYDQCTEPWPSDGPLYIYLKNADTSYRCDAATIANNRVFNADFGKREGVDGGSPIYVRIQDLTEDLAEAVEGLISPDGWYEWSGDVRYEVEQEQQEECLRNYVLSDFKEEIKKVFLVEEHEDLDPDALDSEDNAEDLKFIAITQLLNSWTVAQWEEYFYELYERADAYWEASGEGSWHIDRFDTMIEKAQAEDFDVSDYLFTPGPDPNQLELPLGE